METLNVCPSTLTEGFNTYSPAARKLLFDGKEVSHILGFDSPNNEGADTEEYARHVGRISLSGVQPKASLVLNADGQLVRPSNLCTRQRTVPRGDAVLGYPYRQS